MSPKTTLLIGGGHTHVVVLREWIKGNKPAGSVTLISEGDYQYYSGMLPGMVSGFYKPEECRIDLAELCAQAVVRFIKARAAALDVDQKIVTLDSGERIEFDQISLDTGSKTRAPKVVDADGNLVNCSSLDTGSAAEGVLPVKPLALSFSVLCDLSQAQTASSVTVVGGGAAGVELALALKHRLKKQGGDQPVNLVVGAELLSDQHQRVETLAAQALKQSGVVVYEGRAVVEAESVGEARGQIISDQGGETEAYREVDNRRHLADLVTLKVGSERITHTWVISASGAAPPDWLSGSGLTLDQGFVAVDQFHRSVSHPEVFAAGDVCARQDVTMARSGVHAVRAARALAHNLTSEEPIAYEPKKHSLYLLSLGAREAIFSFGAVSFRGRWVWRLKDWIDRQFIDKGSCGV
jgi:NADH dehydrogenase FAD-containing subunit